MSSQGLPVTVAVTRPDGGIEQVRVGTAFPNGDGFTLRLGELSIGSSPASAYPVDRGPAMSAGGAPGDATVFPPYGRSKGMPIVGASLQDLEFYAGGSRRSLSDPGKARWHDKERVLLAAIEAEIARQRGGEPPPPGAVAVSARSPSPTAPLSDDEPPPPSDDDIPF